MLQNLTETLFNTSVWSICFILVKMEQSFEDLALVKGILQETQTFKA